MGHSRQELVQAVRQRSTARVQKRLSTVNIGVTLHLSVGTERLLQTAHTKSNAELHDVVMSTRHV